MVRKPRKAPAKPHGKPPAKPPRPPRLAVASADDDAHQERLAKITAAVEEALDAAGLSAAVCEQYRTAAHAVVTSMAPGALERFCGNVRGFRFYASHEDLTAEYRKRYPHARITRIKAAFDPKGILHLDGGGTLFSRSEPLAEFDAHEATHALDGTDHLISKTTAWQQAWQKEIVATQVFGKNGASKPSEGFAEFGQLLLATPNLTRTQVRAVLPRCLQVWETHGL
jgi:hypothetical protein